MIRKSFILLRSIINSNYLLLKNYSSNGSIIHPISFVHPRSRLMLGKNVYIGYKVYIDGNLEIEDYSFIKAFSKIYGNVSIGKFTGINGKSELISDNYSRISIGNYCAIAPEVVMMTSDHDISRLSINETFLSFVTNRTFSRRADITIGSDVWIGRRAIILKGVTIGTGAIIGAGAVVTRDIAPYEVVGGVPARHIKWRFPEEIRKKLLESRWWELDPIQLRHARQFFDNTLTQDNIDMFLEIIEKIRKNEI